MSEAHVTDHRPAPASHGSGPVDVPAPRRESPAPSGHPLDHPSLSALHGPHAHFAERRGRVVRYPADVSPWTAMPDEPDARDWADAAALAGPGAFVMFMGAAQAPPADWEDGFEIEGVQLTGEGLRTEAYPEAVRLGAADVPEMLDLVERTRPGPFLPRTVEMGTYLGVRRGGELVAMAGERVHPAALTEISAVCTDPVVRGQGLMHCGWCWPSPTGSRSAARHRFCTRRPTTPGRSGSTRPSASGSAGGSSSAARPPRRLRPARRRPAHA